MDFSVQLPSAWCHWCFQTSINLDFLRIFLSNYCMLPLASSCFLILKHYDLVMLLQHDTSAFQCGRGYNASASTNQLEYNFQWSKSTVAKCSSWKDVVLCNRWDVLEECNNEYSIDIDARAHDEISNKYCISVLQELYVFLCKYVYYSTWLLPVPISITSTEITIMQIALVA